MIGLTIAVVRGETGKTTIDRSFGHDTIDVPMAPGLGLVLDKIHYEKYDQRYGDDGIHEPLIFEKEQEVIEDFFKKHILSTIIDTEIKEKSMVQWVQTLNRHSYDIREPIKEKDVKKSGDSDSDE